MNAINLKDYGINLLTGEACAYSLRILTDYTEQGKTLLESFFDITLHPQPSWNSNTNGEPNVGCIMLTRSIFTDLRVFIGLSNYPHIMVTPKEGVYGLTAKQYESIRSGEMPLDFIDQAHWYHSKGFSRNMHQMSGRTV